ncbi:TRM11 family SAM-dependent methyltransferase [Bacillus sp. AK031]
MNYIYIYSWDENEDELCAMETRALFGTDLNSGILESRLKVDPSRSPFIRERIEVLCEGGSLEELIEKIRELPEMETTFKVMYVQETAFLNEEKVRFEERRSIERKVGMNIRGEAELSEPEIILGIIQANGRWMFGPYCKNEAVWLKHQWKPNSYSTALGTRVARAVANIALPEPSGKKAIDPCCGIGTVLIEALSMGMDIDGSDINPLVLPGVRENMEYFGLRGEVALRDIRNVTETYDAAVIDLPYNLCSVITGSEQLEMLESARRIAGRLVLVTIEPVDAVIKEAGFEIVDRCVVMKGNFRREVILCE